MHYKSAVPNDWKPTSYKTKETELTNDAHIHHYEFTRTLILNEYQQTGFVRTPRLINDAQIATPTSYTSASHIFQMLLITKLNTFLSARASRWELSINPRHYGRYWIWKPTNPYVNDQIVPLPKTKFASRKTLSTRLLVINANTFILAAQLDFCMIG